ncbi:MAG: hypothetical protein ACYC7F_03455 [Gemmatimonadaceae bacterium]
MIRLLLAVVSLLVILEGCILLSNRILPPFEGRSVIGLWFVLIGSAMGLFAWRGRWKAAETTEEMRSNERLTRRLDMLFGGVELLFLAFALLGLLVPSVFGGLWAEHRSSVSAYLALVSFDVAMRLVRRLRRAKAFREA